MARGSIFDLVDALYGGRSGSPVTIDPSNRGNTTKGGQPGDGRTPPWTPPSPTPPGTPPGRPITNPPTAPTTPPRQPRPSPWGDPTIPDMPSGPDPTTPTPTSPDWTGSPSDFNKGQVREQQMPGGGYDPTMQALFGGGFKPYNGLVTGGNKGGQPGGGGGGWGDAGYHGGGQASTYDPLGIGQDNYYGGPYGGLPSSNQNVYNMTGVNAATGYQGPARYGVVGGQGGYGVGMVGPEYSGPIFDDARVALKALRQQRRRLENNDPIQATASPVAATAGVPATGSTTGGSGVDNKGGQPAGPNLLGRLNRINSKLAADPNNAALQARQQRVAGRIKGGQPAWMQPQMMPQGGYNPQAGQQQGLAAPQGKMPAGTPVAPRPQQGGNTGSSPMPVGANGTSSHPGLIWWNGVEILDVGNYTDQWGNITTRDAYAQRRKDLAKFGPGGMLDGSMFKTKFGDLVQSSNGNSNIYKVNGGGENDLYHYDPQEGWKHMTADEYQKYGDYNYYNPLESQDAARAAGAQTYDYWMSGNGNATSAWNPNPRAGFAPDQWDKSR